MQSGGILIGESSVKREQAEDLLKRNSEFERTLTQNENDLRDLNNRVDRINAGIVDLNEKVSKIDVKSMEFIISIIISLNFLVKYQY